MIRWIATLMLLAATALSGAQPVPASGTSYVLKAPGVKSIEATDLPNGMIFKGYEGRPVLLNFFGKHCRYCMKEIPHLVALKKQYGDRLGIIGVHVQERMTPQERLALQKRFGFNYPIFEYLDNVPFVRNISNRAEWRGGIPFSILFDGKGKVVDIMPGYADMNMLQSLVAKAMKR